MLKNSFDHHNNTTRLSPPLSSPSSNPSSTTTTTEEPDESPSNSFHSYSPQNHPIFTIPNNKIPCSQTYKSLAVLRGHVAPVSSLALCGEFVISASHGRDIIVWQNPHLKFFTRFGHGDGSVKALVALGHKIFTAHQDGKIRVWKVSSRSSENVFRLANTLPTTRDYLGNFMKQSSYVQTRRHHRRLWIEHADTISCLAVSNGLIYSGSWDKTLKIWRTSDFKCLESIKAHDDAINSLAASNGVVYSASADGKIKAWAKKGGNNNNNNNNKQHTLRQVLVGRKGVSLNCVVVWGDGGSVYGGGSDGYIVGWGECRDWGIVCEVRAHEMSVLCMCAVGELVCSGSADKSIGVWRREGNGGGLSRYMVVKGAHEGPVKCVQGSPARIGGGYVVFSGGFDKTVRVWWVPPHDSDDRTVSE